MEYFVLLILLFFSLFCLVRSIYIDCNRLYFIASIVALLLFFNFFFVNDDFFVFFDYFFRLAVVVNELIRTLTLMRLLVNSRIMKNNFLYATEAFGDLRECSLPTKNVCYSYFIVIAIDRRNMFFPRTPWIQHRPTIQHGHIVVVVDFVDFMSKNALLLRYNFKLVYHIQTTTGLLLFT